MEPTLVVEHKHPLKVVIGLGGKYPLTFEFISYGVKNGQELPKADCYLDCRGVPNPVFNHSLSGSGDDPDIQKWVVDELGSGLGFYTGIINQGVAKLPLRRNGEHDPYERPFKVCTMCAHGIHRSRAMKHILAQYYHLIGYHVEVK